jgi:hypothetical protein
MRRLDLDYASRPRARQSGTLVLAAGVVLAGTALLEYKNVGSQLSAQEARTAEIRTSGKRNPAVLPKTDRDQELAAQEYKLAEMALQRLSLRWENLFAALEATRADGIALLAVEPDPVNSMVKLTAEAKTAEDMLDYVESLQAKGGLADVALASHQVKPNDPLQPMRFVVLASWMK